MRTYTWHVEDPADDPDALAEGIEALERRGYRVECVALARQMRRRSRDEYLRLALELMPGPTCWGRCVALEKEIAKFAATQWPRLRDRDAPPEGCSKLRECLFRARKIGPLPATARQLLNIVKFGGAGDFAETPL